MSEDQFLKFFDPDYLRQMVARFPELESTVPGIVGAAASVRRRRRRQQCLAGALTIGAGLTAFRQQSGATRGRWAVENIESA